MAETSPEAEDALARLKPLLPYKQYQQLKAGDYAPVLAQMQARVKRNRWIASGAIALAVCYIVWVLFDRSQLLNATVMAPVFLAMGFFTRRDASKYEALMMDLEQAIASGDLP
ncbi:MAG: hypothetical protein AAGF99_03585 [Bacteroidota bacterium]